MDKLKLQLSDFGRARTVPDLVRFGQPLLKTAAAAKAAKSEAFKSGLIALTEFFSSREDQSQLQAIAFAWRITSVTSMRDHRRYIIDCLRNPSPAPELLPNVLSDPDDRKNLAEALRWKYDDWVSGYLIRSIAHEKDGKQARTALCDSLLIKQHSLSTSFEELATELRKLKLGQKDEILGRARQLNNILIAFAEAVWRTPNEFEVGANFGSAYSKLLSSVVDSGDISERTVRIELAESAVEFYVTLTRLRTSLTADSSSYAFVKVVKRVFAPADWPTELEKTIDGLAKQVSEQLIFMLQLKHADKDLRNLFLFLKGEVVGQARLKQLSRAADGLLDKHRYWLEHGKGQKSLATENEIGESALSNFDLDLAHLLRAVDAISEMSSETYRAFENEAGLLPRATTSRIERFFEKSGQIESRAKHLFKSRGLSVRGRIGEIVEFDPNVHEPSADALGEKIVRIASKIVERTIGESQKVVLLKAEVQKA